MAIAIGDVDLGRVHPGASRQEEDIVERQCQGEPFSDHGGF
jgi:hypothetical protein